MDYISSIAYSINNPIVKAISQSIDNYFFYAALVLALVFISQKENKDKTKLVATILLTIIVVSIVKNFFAIERPCFGMPTCPTWYSFPSLHAAIAFCIMAANMSKKEYGYYFIFAIVVCFSRMNLGVHTFSDIAGALPIAFIAYYTIDFVERRMKNG